MKKLLLAFAVTLALAGASEATDVTDTMPSAYDWSGFYAGGHGGYNWNSVDWTWELPDLPDEQDVSSDGDGFGGGVQLGYQGQWGNIVAGVEFSYTWLDGEDSEVINFVSGIDRRFETDVDNLLMIDARLGLAHDRWLGFVKGGYARAAIDLDTYRVEDNLHQTSSDGHEDGFNVGAGVEFGLTDLIVVGADYTYVHLLGDDRSGVNLEGTIPSNHNDLDTDIHMVNGRISLKFYLARDQEKWIPVFRKNHAQTKGWA